MKRPISRTTGSWSWPPPTFPTTLRSSWPCMELWGTGEEAFGVFYQGSVLPPALWLFPDGPVLVKQRSRRAVVTRHAWYDRFTHRYGDMKKSREFLVALLGHYSKWAKGQEGEDRSLVQPRPVIVVGESQGGV